MATVKKKYVRDKQKLTTLHKTYHQNDVENNNKKSYIFKIKQIRIAIKVGF